MASNGLQHSAAFTISVNGLPTDGSSESVVVKINGVDQPSATSSIVKVETGQYRVIIDGDDEWPIGGELSVSFSIDVDYMDETRTVKQSRLIGVVGALVNYEPITVESSAGAVSLTEEMLEVGVNTVMDLATAQYLATINTDYAAWHDQSQQDKIASLLGSFARMKNMCFCIDTINFVDDDGNQAKHFRLSQLTPEDYPLLPPEFIDALQNAGMADSVSASDCDSLESQRAQGIMQARTGESSHFFRGGQPLEFPIAKSAMLALDRWLCHSQPKLARGC